MTVEEHLTELAGERVRFGGSPALSEEHTGAVWVQAGSATETDQRAGGWVETRRDTLPDGLGVWVRFAPTPAAAALGDRRAEQAMFIQRQEAAAASAASFVSPSRWKWYAGAIVVAFATWMAWRYYYRRH